MLSPYWPYILLAALLLALCAALVIFLALRRARRRASAPSAPAPVEESRVGFIQQQAAASIGMKVSFARALRALRGHVTRRDYRYRLPWFLLVGEENSGKTTLLSESGMSLPLGRPVEQTHGVRQGLNWFFFDRAVVLDVAGELVLRADMETSNSRGWATVSRLLQKHRPERPLDGVVLTIPCDDLIAGRGLAPDQRARIEQKAVSLYRKLWEAQKQLGMSFPVYVVVTKCDRVPGFQSFTRSLPARLRDEMFGWSSPYTLETAYRPEWLAEAFQNVYRYLFQAQVELLAERADVDDRDAIFLLPSEMQQLRAPLQLYLDQVFKESSFHESFFFRGVYFCGDAGEDEAAPALQALVPHAGDSSAADDDFLEKYPDPLAPAQPALEPPPAARRPAFVRDLFEKKVFLEDMLARPLTKARLSRNRTVFAAQVLALAIPITGCLGLLVTYGRLRDRSKELYALLKQEEHDLCEVLECSRRERPRLSDLYDGQSREPSQGTRAAPVGGAVYANAAFALYGAPAPYGAPAQEFGAPGAVPPDAGLDPSDDSTREALRDNQHHMLTAMARLHGGAFYSVFIPSSWFSSLNEETRKSLVFGFEHIILRGVKLELDWRTKEFLAARPIDPSPATAFAPDYAPASAFAPAAAEAPGSRPAAPLTFDGGVYPLYDKRFLPGDDGTLHGYIGRFAELREARKLYEGMSDKGAGSLRDLKALGAYLGHHPPSENFDPDNSLYKEALSRAEGQPLALHSKVVLQAVASNVAGMVETLYHRSFEERTRAVSYSYLGDIAQTQAMLEQPEHTWLSTYVFDPRSSFHGMTLSSGLRELRAALEGLSQEKFMAGHAAGAAPARAPRPRRALIWDGETLRRAAAMYADYQRFISARGELRPLDNSVRQAAHARLRESVRGLVAEAQRYRAAPAGPGETAELAALDEEVRSLLAEQETISLLLAASEQVGVEDGLRPALAEQARALLAEADRQFHAQHFYATARPDFSWWEGSKPVAAPAFGADSTDDLAVYLAAQRRTLTRLARELAAPVLDFAAAHKLPDPRPRIDWRGLGATLAAYEEKQPGNSLAVLESFILVGMDKAEVEKCQEIEGGGYESPSRDFFIGRRNALRAQLRNRCHALAEERAVDAALLADEERALALSNYREIAQRFNERLAGRFPFGESWGPPYVEADPDEVFAFFDLLKRKGPAARQALADNSDKLGAAGDEANEFLNRVERVREFFKGYLEKKTGPAFDFKVAFRVNRGNEQGGMQIADWTLDVGRAKYGYRDKELTGRWVFGEPVSLTLRWAKESPVVPYAAPESDYFRARDRVAVFEFKGRWSLLTMMRRQRPSFADFAPYGAGSMPDTLRFVIPTRPGGNAYDSQDEALRAAEARVFMRLALLAPDATELALPDFPASAPSIPGRPRRAAAPAKTVKEGRE